MNNLKDSHTKNCDLSVIMPVKNGEKYIRQAVESILNQTFKDFEFLIIDDGSTDRTPEILKEYAEKDNRIRLIIRKNKGMVATMCELVEEAKGEYLVRMDADDIALPNRIELQIQFLKENRDCVAVGGQVLIVDPHGWILDDTKLPTQHEQIEAGLLLQRDAIPVPLFHPTVTMRKDAVIKVGNYNIEFKASEDRDLWLRLSEIGRLANLSETVLKYRLHSNSFSHRRYTEQITLRKKAIHNAYQRRGKTCLTEELKRIEDLSFHPAKSNSEIFTNWARKAINYGNSKASIYYIFLALIESPFSLNCWKVFFLFLKKYSNLSNILIV